MVAITFIAADESVSIIDASDGMSLMENAVANDVYGIDAICGGNAYCGTCRVYVEPAWRAIVGSATEIELPMLEANADETPGARLSCQITVVPEHEGLIVRMPSTQS